VCLQVLPIDGQRHICEGFCVEQLVEDGQQVALVVIPPQTEALGCHLHWEAVVASRSGVRVGVRSRSMSSCKWGCMSALGTSKVLRLSWAGILTPWGLSAFKTYIPGRAAIGKEGNSKISQGTTFVIRTPLYRKHQIENMGIINRYCRNKKKHAYISQI